MAFATAMAMAAEEEEVERVGPTRTVRLASSTWQTMSPRLVRR